MNKKIQRVPATLCGVRCEDLHMYHKDLGQSITKDISYQNCTTQQIYMYIQLKTKT